MVFLRGKPCMLYSDKVSLHETNQNEYRITLIARSSRNNDPGIHKIQI